MRGRGVRSGCRSPREAGRLTSIEHRDASGELRFRVTYVWNLDNTLYSRTEYDATVFDPGTTRIVTFEYDNRGRLIHERRADGWDNEDYNITYTYDQLGNRLEKTDSVAQRRTYYVYDTDWDPDADQWRSDPAMGYTPEWTPQYETRNNRLLEYREFDISGATDVLQRTVHYTYYESSGNVSNITLKDEYAGEGEVPDEYTWYYDLALYYTTGGNLWQGIWGRYQLDEGGAAINYERQARRAFAYDGHDLVRMRDLPTEGSDSEPAYPETETWRDYFGGDVYSDFQVDVTGAPDYTATLTDGQAYLAGPGLARQNADGTNTRYHHGDLVDSLMMQTDAAGSALTGMAYTAFGERVAGGAVGGELPTAAGRYGYVGGWGYESGHYRTPPEGSNLPGFSDLLALYGPNTALAPLTFQHVGWRWYQPGIGRFLQRDPIGTDDDLNVYAYCECEPTSGLDPEGLLSIRPSGPRWNPGARRWIGPDGRFVKTPARYRKVKGVLIYWSAKKLAQMNYWLWGEPWPGDPEDILFDIGKNVCILWARSFDEPPAPPPPGYIPRWGPGYGCFVEGTPVSTAEGAVSIEAVAQGSAVWGLSNGSVESARVESVHTHATTVLVTLILPSEVIRCTAEHPFWVVDRGWTRAGNLRAGDLLCNQDEECVPVDAVTVDAAPGATRVFNLTVAGGHTFYVGHSRVLVHNKQ